MTKKDEDQKKKEEHEVPTCRRCGSHHGVIMKYGLYYCRQCMREIAEDLGFEKYS